MHKGSISGKKTVVLETAEPKLFEMIALFTISISVTPDPSKIWIPSIKEFAVFVKHLLIILFYFFFNQY